MFIRMGFGPDSEVEVYDCTRCSDCPLKCKPRLPMEDLQVLEEKEMIGPGKRFISRCQACSYWNIQLSNRQNHRKKGDDSYPKPIDTLRHHWMSAEELEQEKLDELTAQLEALQRQLWAIKNLNE